MMEVDETEMNNFGCEQGEGRKHEDSSDEESDDVYFRDSKESNRPLMSPRTGMHESSRGYIKHRKRKSWCERHCGPVLVKIFAGIGIIAVGLSLCILFLISSNKTSQEKLQNALHNHLNQTHTNSTNHSTLHNTVTTTLREKLVGCTNIEVEDVWTLGLPKLLTESAIRLVDVNQDGVFDIIMGFGTGADSIVVLPLVCDVYFNGSKLCGGGLLAVDGQTGKELWRYYSQHELFGINCNYDINKDGINDCLAGGRAAAFVAVSGKDGKNLWFFGESKVKNAVMNVYTAQFVKDFNQDGVKDVLAIHGGDPQADPKSKADRLKGEIIIFSGRDGSVLQSTLVPDQHESYYSPQVYKDKNGTDLVLFGTGGETHGGGLWVISLDELYKGHIDKAKAIYKDPLKGIMTPPVLIDLTKDGVRDIVMSMYNSTVIAYDGQTYEHLWNFSYPMSESYSTPAVGYYNDDDVPDFMIKYSHGPGFPIYYYSITTVLDGRNGQPLVTPLIKDSVGAQTSSLTVSMEGRGNDLFLYWLSDCHGYEGKGGEFTFVKGTNVHEQSRSDFCKLRFKTNMFQKYVAFRRNMTRPGLSIYYSDDRKVLENSAWVNTTEEGIQYVRDHPDQLSNYIVYKSGELGCNKITQKLMEDIIKTFGVKFMQPFIDKAGKAEQKHNTDSDGKSSKTHIHGHHSVDSDYEEPDDNSDMDPADYQSENDQNKRRDKRHHVSKTHRCKREIVNHLNNILRNPNHDAKIRQTRHVGPHDGEGIQRLISTGSLAPPILPTDHPDYNNSIDALFATYWFFPAKTKALLPEDQKCIAELLANEKQRFDPKNKYYGLDHDAFGHSVEDECLLKSNHQLDEHGTYESQTTFNPFNLHMGQMTLYRVRLKCKCTAESLQAPGARCARVLPFDQQQWPAYMGRNADCMATARP